MSPRRAPSFSIVIPVKDDAVGLARAVGSVLAQSVDDFELIVVDDGSVEPACIPRDERILLLRSDVARGPAGARNLGAAAAVGRHLAFCDSDDTFGFARLAHAMEGHRHGATVVVCQQSKEPRDLVALKEMTTFTPHLGCISIERTAWKPLDERYTACEDVEWWIRVGRHLAPSFIDQHDYNFIGTEHPRELHSTAARLAFSHLLLSDHADFFQAHPGARAFRLRRIARFEAGLGCRGAAVRAAFSSFLADRRQTVSVESLRLGMALLRSPSDRPQDPIVQLAPIPRRQAQSWVPLRHGGPDSRLSYADKAVAAAARLGRVLPRVARGYLRRSATLGSERVLARTRWGSFVVGARDTRLLAPYFDEPLETAILARLLEPGSVFVDVGANRGWFTHMAAARVGRNGRVFALEPDGRMLTRLAEMADVNRWTNVTIVPAALSDKTGQAVFKAVADPALSYLAEESAGDGDGVRVPTLSFEDFAIGQGLVGVDAMKIDVEGGEVRVLKGLKRWLSTSSARPILLVEVEAQHLVRAGTSIQTLLESAPDGYISLKIDYEEGGLGRDAFTGASFAGRNVLMVPVEKIGQLFFKIHRETCPAALQY